MYTEKIITLKNGVRLCCEMFGVRGDPVVLLIAGAGSQCKLWPDEFCKKFWFSYSLFRRYTKKNNF